MKVKFIQLIILGFGMSAFTPTPALAKNYIQVETDIMDPIIAKGVSLYASYGINYHIITIGGAINQLPDLLNDQSKEFYEKRDGQMTVEYNYHLMQSNQGVYTGVNINYSNIIIEEISTKETKQVNAVRTGIVIGYSWIPWKGLVVNPYVNPRFSFGFDNQTFNSGKTYTGEFFAPFGGLKLGWRL